jgi:hypothetical protein
MVFKPDRFLNECPFQIDEVKTKRFLKLSIYRVYGSDCPSQPSEGTVTGHIDQATYRKCVETHGMLNSFLTGRMQSALHPTFSSLNGGAPHYKGLYKKYWCRLRTVRYKKHAKQNHCSLVIVKHEPLLSSFVPLAEAVHAKFYHIVSKNDK